MNKCSHKMDFTGEYHIYTDGGCKGNPGPGSYALSVRKMENGKISKMYNLTGVKDHTTNNEMELTAIDRALKLFDKGVHNNCSITLFSDSSYSVKTITEWAPKWKLSNKMESHANYRLIDSILMTIYRLKSRDIKVTFKWIKGHSGIEGNEFVDKLLNDEILKK